MREKIIEETEMNQKHTAKMQIECVNKRTRCKRFKVAVYAHFRADVIRMSELQFLGQIIWLKYKNAELSF